MPSSSSKKTSKTSSSKPTKSKQIVKKERIENKPIAFVIECKHDDS